MPVDEGFSVTPTTSVPTSGLDLAKLASGRVVEARVASVVEGIALVASRHGTLAVDVAAFGRQAPAAGDTVRLQVQAIDGGGKPSFTVVEHSAAVATDPAAAGARAVEDPVLVLARAVRGAAANQTGLAPLYATLAGLRSAPAGTVPEQVRTLVTQLMSGRLAAGSPPTAEAVRKAFLGSGLFLETRLAATPGGRATPTDDLKAGLFSLRAALEKWVGPAPGAATTTASGAPSPATPTTGASATARPGGAGDPSTLPGDPTSGRATGSGTTSDVGSRGPVGRLIGSAYGGGSASSAYGASGGAPAAGRPPVASTAVPGGPPSPAATIPPSGPPAALGSGAAPPTAGAPPVAGPPIAGSTGPAVPPPGSEPSAAGRPVAAVPPGVAGTPAVASPPALAPAIDPGRSGGAPIPGAASPPGARGTPGAPPTTPPTTPAATSATPGGPTTAGAPPTPATPTPSAVPTPAVATPAPAAGLGSPEVGSIGLAAAAPFGTAPLGAPIASTPTLGGTAIDAADGASSSDDLGLTAPQTPTGVPLAGRPGDAAEDGVALLLKAVVRGLEIAGSLTAPRPNEAGEVAAALAAMGPERELKPPPPRRGQAPRGQAALADERIGDDGVEGLGRRALERTEGALSRILLEQFAALDRRTDDPVAAADGRTTREWTAELPLATTGGTGVVQMTVERDGGRERGAAAAAKPAWRVRFSMDVEPLGPVHAQIGLSGEKLSIGLWAERPDAAARLGGDVGRLQGALEAAAIPVESIHLATGRPTTNAAAPTAGRFVDVKL